MTPAEVMPLLRDIHPPPAVAFWPPAPGWWLLAGALALLAWAVARSLPRWRRRLLARAALAELAALRRSPDSATPMAIAILLKRTAMARFGRRRVAALHGRAWLEFLDETGRMDAFCQGEGILLLEAPYRKNPPPEAVNTLAHRAELWIRHVHHDHTGNKP